MASIADESATAFVAGLVVKHGRQIRRYLNVRAENAADVPDLFQEVYLRMLRVQGRHEIRSPEAYLFTIAQTVLLKHTLRQAGTPLAIELSLVSGDIGALGDPWLEVSAEQCLEQLQAGLDGLPPKVRAAFMLSRQEGLSCREIAVRLGTTRVMAKKYLMRALAHLRRQLDPGS
jgi:RNA polymerase sigma-70 factor (ECF subfamily)